MQFAPIKAPFLEPPAPSSYGFQSAGNRDVFLTYYHTPAPQLPPTFSQNSMSQFTPANTELLQTWPPGHEFQPFVNRYTNTPGHNTPSSFPLNLLYPHMYYAPLSQPASALPYTPNTFTAYNKPNAVPNKPNLFTAYGKPNKLQSPNTKRPAPISPSKSGLPPTIKDQEDAHKVPTPLEETEKSPDYLSSRAASKYPAHYVSQEIPVGPSYGFNVVYNPNLAQPNYLVRDKEYPDSESYPSNVMQFTIGQSDKEVPVTTTTTESRPSVSPAALTCKIHSSEEKQAKEISASEPIAILQIFLKPNPTLQNKYRQNVPEDGTSITGNSDVLETMTSPVTQYDETKTNMSSKNIVTENKAGRGQPTIHGLMGNLKEGETLPQEGKEFHGKQNYEDGLKWNQEQRAMQEYLEERDLQSQVGKTIPMLQFPDPWLWDGGELAHPKSLYTSDPFYDELQPMFGQRPYYETSLIQDQNKLPQRWFGMPLQSWETPQWKQVQFLEPYYQHPAQHAPANQSSTDQYLNNNLLIKANKQGLHIQKKLLDVQPMAPFETRQDRINETMEKQMRLNAVKAKLLQQYQSKAAERKERGKQVSASDIPRDVNGSAKVNFGELRANLVGKLSDTEGNTPQIKLRTMGSSNSHGTDISGQNMNKLIQSTTKAMLHDSTRTSHKVRSMSHQEEMPVYSRQIYEENFATTDSSLNAETTDDGNTTNGEKMDPRASYVEQSTSYGLEQTGNASNENSSSPAKLISFINSSMPSVNRNSENSSTEERNINGYGTSHREEKITYPPTERKIHLKSSITDLQKSNIYKQNFKMVPDKSSDDLSQSTEETEVGEQESNKGVDQTPQNFNSAEVSRMNVNPKDTSISNNGSWLREREMKITALPKEKIMPVKSSAVPSGMMTEASLKFNTQENVTDHAVLASTPKSGLKDMKFNTQENVTDHAVLVSTPKSALTNIKFNIQENVTDHAVSTPKSGFTNNKDSKAESNKDNFWSTKMKDTNFRYDEGNVSDDTEAEKVTSSDAVFIIDPRDSVLSETGISSDSHKIDHSDAENKWTNTNKSDTTMQPEYRERGVSLSDVSDKETTSDVIVHSAATMLPTGKTASHDLTRVSSKQLLTSESSSYRSGDPSSSGYNANVSMTFKNKSDYTNASDTQIYETNDTQITGNITESELSFRSVDESPVSEGSLPDSWESTAFTQDQSTNYASESFSAMAEVVRESTASSKMEPWTSTEVASRQSSSESSEVSDEISGISSEDERQWEEENRGISKSLEGSTIVNEKGRNSETDSSTADVYNTRNNDGYSKPIYDLTFNPKDQSKDPRLSLDQKHGSIPAERQVYSESGFSQAPNNEMGPGHSQHRNFGNSDITRTEVFPMFSFPPSREQVVGPSVSYPATMRFMVYPKGYPSSHHHHQKGYPWQFTKILPRPYGYHVPYSPDYSIRYNPHFYSRIPVKNIPRDQRMTEEETERRAQKDADKETVQGKLPIVVYLEE
jgi:hypothetical protein